MGAATIVFTTPEKWDAVTRRWVDNLGLVSKVGLLLIDEVHLLHDSRGATLEAVVSRMRHVRDQLVAARPSSAREPAGMLLRMIALSATLPNVVDIGRWLQCPPENILSFGNEVRPCPLRIYVQG